MFTGNYTITTISDDALIAAKLRVLRDFRIVDSSNYERYKEQFEKAVTGKARTESSEVVIDRLAALIICDNL